MRYPPHGPPPGAPPGPPPSHDSRYPPAGPPPPYRYEDRGREPYRGDRPGSRERSRDRSRDRYDRGFDRGFDRGYERDRPRYSRDRSPRRPREPDPYSGGGGRDQPSSSLWVALEGNAVPYFFTTEELDSVFARYGPIHSISLGDRGFAFVNYYHVQVRAAAVAIRAASLCGGGSLPACEGLCGL